MHRRAFITGALATGGGLALKSTARAQVSFAPFNNGRLARVPASPANGFQWPYFLYLPPRFRSTPRLIIHGPNNIVTRDSARLETTLRGLLSWMTIEYGEKPQTPFLMPAVIRPGLPGWFREWRGLHDNLDTHQLSRQALTTDYRGLERIDLQILSMIDDARRRLGAFGVETPPRVLFTGWSAPGSLADRMTAMHPSRVKALVVGGFGATPMLPVSELDGQPFDFPIGVGDLDALIGAPFDLKTYRQIPYLLQHGEDDANDPIPDVDPKGRKQRKIVQQVLGRRPLDRIEKIRSVYDQVGAHQFELRTYRNADHGGSREIALDIQQFLEKHL